jgi:hypothetical protein
VAADGGFIPLELYGSFGGASCRPWPLLFGTQKSYCDQASEISRFFDSETVSLRMKKAAAGFHRPRLLSLNDCKDWVMR